VGGKCERKDKQGGKRQTKKEEKSGKHINQAYNEKKFIISLALGVFLGFPFPCNVIFCYVTKLISIQSYIHFLLRS